MKDIKLIVCNNQLDETMPSLFSHLFFRSCSVWSIENNQHDDDRRSVFEYSWSGYGKACMPLRSGILLTIAFQTGTHCSIYDVCAYVVYR